MKREKYGIRKIGKQLLAAFLCGTMLLGQPEMAAFAREAQFINQPQAVAEQGTDLTGTGEMPQTSQPEDESTAPETNQTETQETPEAGQTESESTETETGQTQTEQSETEETAPATEAPETGESVPETEETEETSTEEETETETETETEETETEETETLETETATQDAGSLIAVDENFPNVVYVGVKHGQDLESELTGQSPAYPYETLEEAYKYVTENGTIKIVDSLTVDSWPSYEKNVTIEGWKGEIGDNSYNDPTILMGGDWILKGDTKIQKLTIKQKTTGNKAVYPEGHRLQIGSGEEESTEKTLEEGRIAPRVADTFIRDIKNGSSEWFRIGTGPADGKTGDHIETVDVRVYAGGSWVSIESTPGDSGDPTCNIINTPNLKEIYIELVGSQENPATLPDAHWYNGMAPAFDGTKLEKVNISLGYVKFYKTHSLFRSGTDKDYKTVRKVGSFPINYTLDHVSTDSSSTGKPEAIAFGEVFTTGDMTIDVWESDFQGTTSTFALGVFAGQCGTIQVNLHDSTLKGLGNYWTKMNVRNKDLKYDKFELVLDNSIITDHTAFQDDVQITLKGDSSLGSLNYYPNISDGVSTECNVINEGHGTISNISRNPVNIQNAKGAELVLAGTTDKVQNVENKGIIRLEETQTWQGNYGGGAEEKPGKLIFPTGTTLNIRGEVTGKTVALAEQTESGSQIATIIAGKGNSECITWDENLGGTKIEQDGYWMLNLGEENFEQEGYVYVRYGGSDTNDGTSYNDAVKSLCRAYELAIKEEGTEPKKIVICDTYPFSNICEKGAEHAKVKTPVVVTTTDGVTNFGEDYGAKLIADTSSTYISKGGMSLQHSFEFQHITITDSTKTPQNNFLNIYANGYPTVMGEGVELIPYTSIFGGSENAIIKGTRLTILDGTYFHIYGGNYGSKMDGNIELIVKNANFRTTGYGEEDTMSIVGGNMEGAVNGNIFVEVTPENGQEITNVLRIVGGSYGRSSSHMTGNIDMEVSGAVNFRAGTPSLVNNAIVGGNFKNSNVTGNINLTVQDITGTGTPYIIGGNGWTNKVNGDVTLTVDNLHANRIIGGCGWTYATTTNQNSWGAVTGDITMNIGQTGLVQTDSIHGCSGDMGSSAASTGNKEYKPKSMTMNLGQVSAGTVSGGLMGINVSDTTREVLSLNIQEDSQIRELLEFGNINVAETVTLIYDGTILTSDTLENNGTIQYQEGSVSVNSDYQAGENARIKLNSHTTVTHEKAVSGKTKVSSVSGNRALTVRAFTEKIEASEEEKDKAFVSENGDKPLLYSSEENMSVWKYDPIGAGTRAFVYVDGQRGNDEWDGTKPQQAADSTAGEDGEEITSGPVRTLERAYEMIKDGGSIIVCGKTEISRWPNVQKKAFITSDAALVEGSNDSTDYREGNTDEQGAENTGLFFKPGTGNKYLLLEDDLTLRNLDFHYEYEDKNGGIDANGNKLIIGDKKDTYTGVTDVQPDVCFYKIQDGKRVKPDTFLLVGGGLTRKTLEQIYLEIYNTEVKAVIGLWGGSTETDQRIVNGNVNLILQDCKTSKRIHYCSNDTFVDSTDDNQYSGGYGVINGDANVSIAFYNNNMPDAFPGSLCGLKRVKNMKTGTLHYLNTTRHMWQMGVTTTAGMFHAADKCNIIYESNGTGDIRFDTIYPVDSNTTLDGGENSQVEVTFLGKITIYKSALIGVNTKPSNLSVILNLGNEERGSENILFASSKQLVNQSNTNAYNLKSYHINYYPGANVKFDIANQPNITTVADGRPVVVLHSLQQDVEAGKQTEYIINEPDFVGDAVLECDNVKVTSSINMGEGDKQLDLRLINGASYAYDKDDFALNGSLTMEAGTQLVTNGTVSIEKDLNLKENAVFPVENFLTVGGKINSEPKAALLVNNEANAAFGGASGETRVDYNGTDGKGYFLLQATKGGENADPESYAKDRFTGGTDKEQTTINLIYDDKQTGYVTWTYGKQEPLDEIFLDEKRGLDTNSGSRPGLAVKTFKKALELAADKIEAAKADEQKQVQIVISGKYAFEKKKDGEISEDLAAKLKGAEIIVTQRAGSIDALYRSEVSVESGFEIPCSLIFQDIKLTFSGTKPELYAGGKALTIGEKVTVQAEKEYPSIYGGHETDEVNGDTSLNIYSGTWFRIYGGGKSGDVTGNTHVTLGDVLSQSAPHIRTEKEDNNFNEINTNAVFGGGETGTVNGTAQVDIAYGADYGYVFGGGLSGTVNATEVTVDHRDAKLYRIYGGSPTGKVTGQAKVNFESGTVNRIYGGGIDEGSTVGFTQVSVGRAAKEAASAVVTDYLRGSGERGGVTENALLQIMDGARIEAGCKAAAGGYTGGVAKSSLQIMGGEIYTDIYAGGAGEFKLEDGQILDEIDPTKGVVSASEVTVSGGTVYGSVFGGGNMGSVGTAPAVSNTAAGNVEEQPLTTATITGGVIEGDVYGGGSLAPTYGNIQMTLSGGQIKGGAFGGGKGRVQEGSKKGIAANVAGTTMVSVEYGAQAKVGIYGGCNLNGQVDQTQVQVKAPVNCSVYGAGLGADTYVETTKVELAADQAAQGAAGTFLTEEGAAYPAVYGGGDRGQTGASHVTVENWNGDVYGGGRGAAEAAGAVTAAKNLFRTIGNAGAALFSGEKPFAMDGLQDANTKETHVTINGSLTGNAYGGGELATVGSAAPADGNKTGSPAAGTAAENAGGTKVTNVVIADGAVITGNVYGGGKGAKDKDFAMIYGDTSVLVQGGEAAGCIFGGGQIAPVSGSTYVTAEAGKLANVFGGNDVSGKIGGNTNVRIADGQTQQTAGDANASPLQVENVYGGGQNAAYDGPGTKVEIVGGQVENAYGGGKGAEAVCDNTSLTITGGRTNRAFAGGNAATVAINAELTVNVPAADAPSVNAAAKEAENVGGADTDGAAGEADVQLVFAGNNQAAMAIQPTIKLKSGQIGTFYGGGNRGDMTAEGGLHYDAETFGSEDISIQTVFGGCNQADVTNGVTLELTKGRYNTVYGGNNQSGEANESHVILNGPALQIANVYGGGNKASLKKASVTALQGTIENLYGGGNEATVTESVKVTVGQAAADKDSQNKASQKPARQDGRAGSAQITNLYCGNNQAVMQIAPEADLQAGKVTNFYGGGNQGAMDSGSEQPIALSYRFDSDAMEIENVYGGGSQADVKGSTELILAGARVQNAYGGCNTSGQVDQTNVILRGGNTVNIFGGGQGKQTFVAEAQVTVENGLLQGNVYGGSGFGTVKNARVTVQEKETADRIQIRGSVFGGGYGESSMVENSRVTVAMALAIAEEKEAADKKQAADLIVKEASAETAETAEDAHSGETKTTVSWQNGAQEKVSYIQGSVYGGGDMGKVGDGRINQSANTAEIDVNGCTQVQVSSGYIKGSVFGGGSGTPAGNLPYTAYMGTVFGSCAVDVTGGYVEGSIYGCGHQSRVYATEDQPAATVNIKEPEATAFADNAGGVVIGTSVFGGGNKGEGNNQNASVYTVVGDTRVNISGVENKQTSTKIYFLSDSRGGVYGDGNLCLVNGMRTVNLTDFNYGSENKGLLKTFYSLQRADEVNLTRSRVVLRGAKDLVDETADDTEYAVNRVGQLNMKESSAVKLTTVVNLLGGLSSDQNPATTYIDRGNNGINGYSKRGGEKPKDALTEEQIAAYQAAYQDFLDKGGKRSQDYTSFNVICVANGSYLEIKKSDTEYGNVTGLFTLELLHANPGEGGGFVYAEIGSNTPGSGSTGDFICTTPNEEPSEGGKTVYMDVKDTVGGYSGAENGDYTYYYWYIKGGRYAYRTHLNGYIGTTETEFDTAVDLTELGEDYHYILNSITGAAPVPATNSGSAFCEDRFVDHWTDAYNDEDKYAIEVCMVPSGSAEQTQQLKPVSLGYLSYGEYGTDGESCWAIKKTDGSPDGTVITGTGDENVTDTEVLKKNDVYTVQDGTTGLALQFVLHKGTGVTVEFKNVPVKLSFDVFKGQNDGYETGDGTHLTVETLTSITRLVPTQAAYISSGRLYAGVSSDIPVNITKNSAFTAQFITKFVPSAFNTSQQQIKEVLTTKSQELYLLDPQTGIGFTAVETDGKLELTYATEGSLTDYKLTQNGEAYQVTYLKTEEGQEQTYAEAWSQLPADGKTRMDADGQDRTHTLEVTDIRREAMALPKGTVITLVAQIDDHAPTYWYYYCTGDAVEEIPLKDFRRMGSAAAESTAAGNDTNSYSFANASDGKISAQSSNRVTENLTFVFDFSNVTEKTASSYPGWDNDKAVEGALRLKHLTTIGSIKDVDIMDYVAAGSKQDADGNPVSTYERVHPAISKPFTVSREATGIKEFHVQVARDRTLYTKDRYQIDVSIKEDEEFVNTQYEEREYAVVLQQIEADGQTVIPFPEGTLFTYEGQTIVAGNANRSVTIPVKKSGAHRIEMQTVLEGFKVGKVHLQATLYSSSVASYYNALDTHKADKIVFTVTERPEAALQITAAAQQGTEQEQQTAAPAQQLYAPGQEVSLTVTCKRTQAAEGTVALYQYDRGAASYQKRTLDALFENAADSFAAAENGVAWSAAIKNNAQKGTYRLEFQYEDKTQYWDLIVGE